MVLSWSARRRQSPGRGGLVDDGRGGELGAGAEYCLSLYAVAEALDRVFPERSGWFTDWYRESLTWSEVPAGFRNWSEFEESARHLHARTFRPAGRGAERVEGN